MLFAASFPSGGYQNPHFSYFSAISGWRPTKPRSSRRAGSQLKASAVQRFKMAKGLPFFGIGLEIEGGKYIARVMERLADEIGDEGVFEATMFGQRIVFVCSWEEAKKMMEPRPSKVRRIKNFDNIKALVNGLFLAEGRDWKRQRRLTAPAFHPKAVQNYLPAIAKVIRQVGERAAEECSGADGKINISPLMKLSTSAVLVTSLTGIDIFSSDYLPVMAKQVDAFFNVLQTRYVMPPYWKIPILGDMLPSTRDAKQMRKMIEDLIQKTGHDPEGKTLLSKLKEAQDEDKLTHEELVGSVITLFTGGTDTTANTATWALYLLSKRPDLQDRLAAEASAVAPDGVQTSAQVEQMKLARAVWKETLRLYMPASFLVFTTLTSFELAGRTVPPDTNVFILLRTIFNKCPDIKKILGDDLHLWNPDRWLNSKGDVHEFPLDGLAFGYGARTCVGKHLADDEGILLISEVCRRIQMEPCVYEAEEISNFANGPDRDIVLRAKKRVMK